MKYFQEENKLLPFQAADSKGALLEVADCEEEEDLTKKFSVAITGGRLKSQKGSFLIGLALKILLFDSMMD